MYKIWVHPWIIMMICDTEGLNRFVSHPVENVCGWGKRQKDVTVGGLPLLGPEKPLLKTVMSSGYNAKLPVPEDYTRSMCTCSVLLWRGKFCVTNISDITKNLLNWVSGACWVEKKNSCRGKIVCLLNRVLQLIIMYACQVCFLKWMRGCNWIDIMYQQAWLCRDVFCSNCSLL